MKKFLTKNQLLLLRVFFTNPEKSFFMQEIGRAIGKKPGVFQRTLNGLEAEGILKSEYRAGARFFQVNNRHPLYLELKKIIHKTIGIEGLLRELLVPLKDIKTAFIYGSFAKGKERKDSDVDLLVVGKPSVETRLLPALRGCENQLRREINYKLYSEKEFNEKRKMKEPFLEEISRGKKIILKGNPDVV